MSSRLSFRSELIAILPMDARPTLFRFPPAFALFSEGERLLRDLKALAVTEDRATGALVRGQEEGITEMNTNRSLYKEKIF